MYLIFVKGYANICSLMDPPIEDSIIRTKQNKWVLGSLYVCEVVVDVADDAVTS